MSCKEWSKLGLRGLLRLKVKAGHAFFYGVCMVGLSNGSAHKLRRYHLPGGKMLNVH